MLELLTNVLEIVMQLMLVQHLLHNWMSLFQQLGRNILDGTGSSSYGDAYNTNGDTIIGVAS